MNTPLYKTVVSQHKTMRWQTKYGSVSIRKSAGRYHVYCEYYVENDDNHEIHQDFATLRGAETAFNGFKDYYL